MIQEYPMRTLRVVCVDPARWLSDLLDCRDLPHEIVYGCEIEDGLYDKFAATKNPHESGSAMTKIRQVAAAVQTGVDLIVVGNNMGAGVDVVRGLLTLEDPTVLDKLIVVGGSDFRRYAELGCKYHAERTDYEKLLGLIREIAPPAD
jgi:hypothetical protein